jgi:hypothetical protein
MNRTRVASAHLTPIEQASLLAQAKALGVRPGELYRRLLLGDHQPEMLRIILAELREMRMIVMEINTAAIRGEPITRKFLKDVLDAAEAAKFDRADRVLERSTAA